MEARQRVQVDKGTNDEVKNFWGAFAPLFRAHIKILC